ncbi:MAG TPA: hypothetical protein VFB73_18125 [Chloroflexota bacterium]|jgi:hypothetical protein|nr:hypothetical protein [Chloroflexota bacterium]
MTRVHLARRSATLFGVLILGLAVLAPLAAPAHARVVIPAQAQPGQYADLSGCPTLGGYVAFGGVYFDYPYVAGLLSGYGFGHGYPFYGTPYPIWGGGFGYVPYTYYPAVGTPAAGVAPGYLSPLDAYHPAPFPIGMPAPPGIPYFAGFPFPPTYPWFSYPQYGGQPIGAFLGFWDPFYTGRGAGQAGQYGYTC